MLNTRHNMAQTTDQVYSASPSAEIVNAVTTDEGNQPFDEGPALQVQSRHHPHNIHESHPHPDPLPPLQPQFKHNPYQQHLYDWTQSPSLFNPNSPFPMDYGIPDFAAQKNGPYVYKSGNLTFGGIYPIRDIIIIYGVINFRNV